MPWFEIEPQWAGAGKRKLSVKLEAETWMDALKDGAQKLRPGSAIKDIQVHFDTDGAISVLQPEDGVRLRIVQLDGPPKPSRAKDEVSTIREAKPLMERPKLAPGVRYPTFTAGRPALPPPPPRSASPAASALVDRPSGELPTRVGRVGSASRNKVAPAAAFQLTDEHVARIKRACWSGWGAKAAESLLELSLELIPSQAGSTYRVDSETGNLELVAAWGPRAARLLETGLTLEPGEGLAGFSVLHGVLVVVANPDEDPRFRRDLAQRIGFPVGSALVAPLMARGGPFGCLQLLNRKSGQFSDLDSAKLSQVARTASGFLEKGVR